MHNSQTLLSWAHSIYDWLIASSAPRRGSGGLAASRDVLRVRYALHGSLVELVTAWPGLVPLDQEDIVDCLLRAACAAASTGHFDAIAVTFPALTANLRQRESGDGLQDAIASFAHIRIIVHVIKDRYVHNFLGEEAAHQQRHAAFAEEWAANLLGPSGISLDKLRRIGSVATQLVHEKLVQISDDAQPGGERDTLWQKLWSADKLFTLAQIHAEPPERRFEAYKHLVASFHTLYSVHSVCWDSSSPNEKVRQAVQVAADVRSLTDVTAFAEFRVASVVQQQQSVVNLRAEVYELCSELHHTRRLPDAQVALGRLSPHGNVANPQTAFAEQPHPLMYNPHAYQAWYDPSIPPGAVLHSLARSAPGRISDHYARRYYRTTAAEWEAARA